VLPKKCRIRSTIGQTVLVRPATAFRHGGSSRAPPGLMLKARSPGNGAENQGRAMRVLPGLTNTEAAPLL
jgi:hypothetical protein